MNREVHVRFWESAGLRCPAPLDYLKDYEGVTEAVRNLGKYFEFYNRERPHQSLDYATPASVYFGEGARGARGSVKRGVLRVEGG
ncbi:MAG: integrase core domain-containing protein [Terriglobia bacterium]